MIFVPVIAPDPHLSAEGVVLRVPNDGDASWMAEACNDPDIAPVHRRDAARSVGAERRGTRRPAVHLARYETGRLDARAKLLARRGSHAQAESLAREAVALADKTEAPDMQAGAYTDLAEVLSLTGHPDRARAVLEEALTRYERKGVAVMA